MDFPLHRAILTKNLRKRRSLFSRRPHSLPNIHTDFSRPRQSTLGCFHCTNLALRYPAFLRPIAVGKPGACSKDTPAGEQRVLHSHALTVAYFFFALEWTLVRSYRQAWASSLRCQRVVLANRRNYCWNVFSGLLLRMCLVCGPVSASQFYEQ